KSFSEPPYQRVLSWLGPIKYVWCTCVRHTTSSSASLALRSRAHIGRRCAEALPKGAVEVGEVAEAYVVGDGADAQGRMQRIAQNPAHAREPFAEQELRERCPLAL